MLRQLHSIPGLVAALLLALVGLTGSVLSVYPGLEWAQAAPAGGGGCCGGGCCGGR